MASLTGEMQGTPARKVLLPKELKSLSGLSSSGGFHGQGTPALSVLHTACGAGGSIDDDKIYAHVTDNSIFIE